MIIDEKNLYLKFRGKIVSKAVADFASDATENHFFSLKS